MSEREELAVIGHALSSRDYYEMVIAEFTQDHFKAPEVKYVFNLMLKFVENGRRPTFTDLSRITEAFGVVHSAWDEAKNSTDPERDFSIVRTEFFKLQYRRMSEQLKMLTMHDFEPEQAEEIINSFMPYSREGIHKEYMVTAGEAKDVALDELQQRLDNPGVIPGVSLSYKTSMGSSVGFKSIDDVLYGLRGGDLIMIGAQSGHGKTALAMNLTRIISFHNNKRLYYLNTEMNISQMVNRWAAMATRTDYSRIERGELEPHEVKNYREWCEKFGKSPLLVSRIPSLSPNLVKALAERAIGKYGKVDCLVVDYVGRMSLDNTRNMQEWQIMSAITKELKEIAQELDVPIIALAQLNEEGKLEGAKKMRNECDGLFFFRPKKVEAKDESGNPTSVFSDSEYFLIKEKVRRGSTDGVIACEFVKSYQFIREV